MDPQTLLKNQRVARLATTRPDGRPHIVPVVYTSDGKYVYIVLDDKPKRKPPMELQRVRNIQANPHVSILVDVYEEDWSKLAWVRVDGTARILWRGEAHDRGIQLLRAKYPQYRRMRIDADPVIRIKITRVVHWEARG